MTPPPAWGDPARVRGRGQTAAAGGPGTPGTHGATLVRADDRPGRWGLRELLDTLELVRKELPQGAGGGGARCRCSCARRHSDRAKWYTRKPSQTYSAASRRGVGHESVD